MVESKQQWKAWLILSPAIILLLIFTVWPIVNTLRMAFLNGYGLMSEQGGEVFSFGVQNFIKVLQYNKFLDCLKNTMLLTVLTVPISTFLALLISVCLNSIKFLSRTLQTIFFLPYVTNSIAIGMVFAAMFNIVGNIVSPDLSDSSNIITTAGIINNVIEFFGGTPVNWINAGSSYWANITVMVIYIVWNALPFKILILLGGLQSVNKQYYDAAKVDGTSRRRIFTRITVPLLSPMIAYVVITGFIGGFKEYSSIVGIFGEARGPVGAEKRLNTMVGFIYDSLENDAQGRASAAALILFLIILAVTLLNLYVSKKRVHYGMTKTKTDIGITSARQKTVGIIVKILLYAFLIAVAISVLFPFYWMVISSLKERAEYELSVPTFFPRRIMFSNYARAFEAGNLGRLFINTMIVGIISTLLSLVITVLTAFAFARLEFKGKNLLFAGLLATMMIPGELFTITNYVTVNTFGWMKTYRVLIIPFLVSVFYIYLLRQNFLQIPNELYLAAKVDGTGDLKYLWKVMVPLSMPTLISITILKMRGAWNSYVWPRLVANDDAHKLITNGLRSANLVYDDGSTNFPVQMAAVALVSIPLFLVFIFLRKYIMKGVSRSGIKG